MVEAVLQEYAHRGVFRGFSTTRRQGGRYDYTFTWLMSRPFTLSYDPARRSLSFKALLPHVQARSPMAAVLRHVVAERSTGRVPRHKRFDGRKVQAVCGIHRGSFRLTVRVRGPHEADAVRHLLGLVNELFLALHEMFPDYLIAEFGLSPE
jgi:hypothetical protein